MTPFKACGLFAACIFSTSVVADEWKPLDQRLKEFRPYVVGALGVASGVESKDSVSFFKLGAGVKMGRYVAIEINRVDAGKFSQDKGAPTSCDQVSNPSTCTGNYFQKTELKLDGFGVGLIGYLPLSPKVNVLGRIDVIKMNQDIERTGQSSTTPFTDPGPRTDIRETRSEKLNYYGLGLGAERKIGASLFVRGMAEYYTSSLFGGEEGEKFFSANVQMLKRL